MKKISMITLLAFVFFCANAGTIKVVTTLTDLKSITELIGGDKVSVTSIATGYQNPHFVDPKPSYIISLSNADMYVTVGLDLETGWSPQLLSSSRNTKIQKGSAGYVDASDGMGLLKGSHCCKPCRRRYSYFWQPALLARSFKRESNCKKYCERPGKS